MTLFTLHFALAFGLSYATLVRMGLITDLLKESPLKAPQLESIALIEKRMEEEKLAAVKEVERLKTEVDRVRNEMQQARSLSGCSSRRLLSGGARQGREKTAPLISRGLTREVDPLRRAGRGSFVVAVRVGPQVGW